MRLLDRRIYQVGDFEVDPAVYVCGAGARNIRCAGKLFRRCSTCLSLSVGLMAGWLVLRPAEERSTAAVTVPRAPGKKPVAVMYFENRANDRELDWLREGLADMLITGLSRSQRLTLLSRHQLAALLGRIGDAKTASIKLEDGLEIARRAQAEMIILGGFARLGEKVRIDVKLHDVQMAHYHLGQIYERKGEAARARTAYNQFLQDWQGADDDIPEVREAAAKLANLR